MSVREEIGQANRRFMDTFGKGDAQGVAALYTDDGQLLPTGGDVVTGHEAIAGFWSGAMEMGIAGAELDTRELDELGDTAIEVGRYTLHSSGQEVLDEGKYLVVWKKDGDAWKLHRDIWNTSRAE